MLNVLIIANELRNTCGVTNHILHLARSLSESGKVKLFIICGGGNGVNRFDNLNVSVDKRFFHKGRNFKNYFSAITYLAKYLRKNKINIIHSHSHYAANIAANAVRISKASTVQTNHGLLQVKGRLKHFNAHKYIVINEHIREYLISNKISSPENIELIRCGIPVDDSPAGKNTAPVRVIAASRFTYEKGLDLYVKAVAKLDNKIKVKAEFLIAGEGETEKSLIELNNELNSGIKFIGSVGNMYDLLRETNILVYPSRSCSEGFPAIITEAGACNNLVISSKFPGAEYILKDKMNSLLFEIDDIDGLTSHLETAINGYTGHLNLTLGLYNTIKEKFGLEEMINKHLSLYNSLI